MAAYFSLNHLNSCTRHPLLVLHYSDPCKSARTKLQCPCGDKQYGKQPPHERKQEQHSLQQWICGGSFENNWKWDKFQCSQPFTHNNPLTASVSQYFPPIYQDRCAKIGTDLDGTTLTYDCRLQLAQVTTCVRLSQGFETQPYHYFFRVVCNSLGEVVRLIYTKQSVSYGWREQVACDSRKSKLCRLNRPLQLLVLLSPLSLATMYGHAEQMQIGLLHSCCTHKHHLANNDKAGKKMQQVWQRMFICWIIYNSSGSTLLGKNLQGGKGSVTWVDQNNRMLTPLAFDDQNFTWPAIRSMSLRPWLVMARPLQKHKQSINSKDHEDGAEGQVSWKSVNTQPLNALLWWINPPWKCNWRAPWKGGVSTYSVATF